MSGLDRSTIGAVALGGALGTAARDLVSRGFDSDAGAFPTAVLIVNLIGALALGYAHSSVLVRNPRLRPLLAVGVLGAFTTFGAVMVGVVDLVRLGHEASAWAFLTATIVGGLTSAWVGLRLGASTAAPADGDRS